MLLTRHRTGQGARWANDGVWLPLSFTLGALLELPRAARFQALANLGSQERANDELVAPVEPQHEVWAAGVTYLRSRDARAEESQVATLYDRVYDAPRPELFFKAIGWRVVGPGRPIRVRRDSRWSVPEPELVVVVNSDREIVGYTAGNDVSSRDIEGENPLYLPQAKIYAGSCALGHGIVLGEPSQLTDLEVRLQIERAGAIVFEDATTTAAIKRPLAELTQYLTSELDFPQGVFLMTGTGIVPDPDFTLQPGDLVRIQVGACKIENPVAE